MRSITIGSTKIHDVTDSTIHTYVHIPIPGLGDVPQRVSQFNRAGEDGAYIANIFQGQRVISIDGIIIAQTGDTFLTMRRTIAELQLPSKDSNGVLQAKTCTFVWDDGTSFTITGQVAHMKLPDRYLKSAPFQFDIVCQDWFFKSGTGTTTLNVASGGGVILPVILPAVFAAGVGNTGSATNNGDIPTYPIITINGTVTNPRIVNVTTNQFTSLAVTVGATQTLVLDMQNKTAVLGTTTAMQYIQDGSTWWSLSPGGNSLFFSSSNSGDTGTVAVAFAHAYSGI